MLHVRGLCKAFGRPAVDHLDLSIAGGEIYALLGPNGAGKTTTLRMVCGLLTPDAGSIVIAGIDALADPAGAKRVTAWLPDEPLLYDRLTPLEYLEFVAGLWRVPAAVARRQAESLLIELGLWPHRGERCEGFSRGMRQKTALAGALLHDPPLLIMDEPLSGLDAAASRQVKDLLRAARAERARGGADHACAGRRRTPGRPHRHHRGRPHGGRGHLRRLARAGRRRAHHAGGHFSAPDGGAAE